MSSQQNPKLKIDVVGATGAVGVEILRCLEGSQISPSRIRLFASPRSAGRKVEFRSGHGEDVQTLIVEAMDEDDWLNESEPADLVFLAAGGDSSRRLGRRMAARGPIVIDNSSAFRMDDDVPLIIPEINGSALKSEEHHLIANPNCSTIVALMALAPLHSRFGLESYVASTYQAVSGAGQQGLDELMAQTRAQLAGESTEPSADAVFARPIAFNVLPFIGSGGFGEDTDEELKMRRESQKILGVSGLDVSCTAVRVPVLRAHAVSIVAHFHSACDVEEAVGTLSAAAGVRVQQDCDAAEIWTPQDADGGDDVLVTRLRTVPGTQPRLALFAIGDQLRKGAALNAVQIAEAVFCAR